MRSNVLHPQADDVASSELAINGQIEHGQPVRRAICSLVLIDQTCFGRRGGFAAGVDLVVMTKIGKPFGDVEQVLVLGAPQDLHIAGVALRTERPEPRELGKGAFLPTH
jgi:hypothetical protein